MTGPRRMSDDEELEEFGAPVFEEGQEHYRRMSTREDAMASAERKLKEIKHMLDNLPERRILGIMLLLAYEPEEDRETPMVTMGGGIGEQMIFNAAQYFADRRLKDASSN